MIWILCGRQQQRLMWLLTGCHSSTVAKTWTLKVVQSTWAPYTLGLKGIWLILLHLSYFDNIHHVIHCRVQLSLILFFAITEQTNSVSNTTKFVISFIKLHCSDIVSFTSYFNFIYQICYVHELILEFESVGTQMTHLDKLEDWPCILVFWRNYVFTCPWCLE